MGLFEMLFDEMTDRASNESDESRRILAENAKLRVDAVYAISMLTQENDRLRLYCAALVRLLLKKGLISLDEISKMIDTVDPEDGFLDGKLKGRPLPGERPKPGHLTKKPVAKKPLGNIPKAPAKPLAKPPKGWKPKGEIK